MKRKMPVIFFLIVWLANAVMAQTVVDRLIPRTDLDAVPGPGESEVRISSNVKDRDYTALWFNVYIDGRLAAQVEPGIPEKIVVKNGFAKIKIVAAEYNARRRRWTDTGAGAEIVYEANSNSTSMEITDFFKWGGRVETKITKTEPLTPSTKTPARAAPRPSNADDTGTIVDALYRAGDILINTLPENSTLAILSVSTRDREMAEFVIDELAYVLVNTGNYKIVDRRSLEAIRTEQNFQSSGEVDDDSAVSIGKLLGANVVVTGSVSGSDSMRRLRLKALDVQTAQIVAMSSERF
ncbi:MAG: CsgG/HfaB family protein [Treponema sp.]|jgi:hypothetical protein|nr:CsgG/HfaB family protein [Treponema sp.]